MLPTIMQDAKQLGITFHVSTINGAFPTLQTTNKNIAIAIFPGWAKDYADALTFFNPLFDGRTIIPQGNVNYSLVGMKPSQAKALGVTGTITGIPERRRRARPLRRARRPGAPLVLRGARQEADDPGRAVGAVPVGQQRRTSSGRTSRSGSTTSSAARPPTRTSP